jgi:arsenate reductase
MSNAIIYHNPKCSKSRKALEILESNNIKIDVREYLVSGLSVQEIQFISDSLELPIIDFIRKKEEEYKALNIDWTDKDQAIDALSKFPKILERPIIIKDSKGIIARPPENLEQLF